MKRIAGLTFVVGVIDNPPLCFGYTRYTAGLPIHILYCHEDCRDWYWWQPDREAERQIDYLLYVSDVQALFRLTLSERFELARYAMPRLLSIIDEREDDLLQSALLKAAGQKEGGSNLEDDG